MNMYTNLYQNSQCFAQSLTLCILMNSSRAAQLKWAWDGLIQGLQIRVCNKKKNSYFSTKTYVVDTQKNRLNETVLLSNQIIC